MNRRIRKPILVLVTLYIIVGNTIAFTAFILGIQSGDTLFLIFYPCTFFWAFAYVLGPWWALPGLLIAALQGWMVWVGWRAVREKS